MKKLKRYLGAGILITAPIGITLYLAWMVIDGVDAMVEGLIPPQYAPEYSIPGLGFLIVVALLILIGTITAGYVGGIFRKTTDLILKKMPVLHSIYNTLQQIFETVFSTKGNSFKEVVLVEYPLKGTWAMAFITSDTGGELKENFNDEDYVNIFLPTTPNPTSGFLLFLPRNKVKTLEMSVEEGIKLIISAGIMTPLSSKEKVEARLLAEAKKLTKKTRKPRVKKGKKGKKSPMKKPAKKKSKK
jgi:uncharacterized membrane protein